MTVGAIWLVPEAGRAFWPDLIGLGSPEAVYFGSIYVLSITMIIVLNLGMWAIYSVRWTFF